MAGRRSAGARGEGRRAGNGRHLARALRSRIAAHAFRTCTWRDPPGLAGWIAAVNHKSIGRRFIVTAFGFFVAQNSAKILLNRAEALARTTGVTQEAVTLLNTVRNRSKGASTPAYTVASFANAQALINAILLERRLELAFEGHRYYDLLRTRQNIPARGTAPAVPYGDNRVVLPIPQVDIQNNPNLVQNPGY